MYGSCCQLLKKTSLGTIATKVVVRKDTIVAVTSDFPWPIECVSVAAWRYLSLGGLQARQGFHRWVALLRLVRVSPWLHQARGPDSCVFAAGRYLSSCVHRGIHVVWSRELCSHCLFRQLACLQRATALTDGPATLGRGMPMVFASR